jgi:hypothetical protein
LTNSINKRSSEKASFDAGTANIADGTASGYGCKGLPALRRFSYFSWPNYARISHRFLLAYCLSAALSIAAAQILLLTVLAFWTLTVLREGFHISVSPQERSTPSAARLLVAPILSWLLAEVIASLCGIDPLRSLTEVVKSSVFLLLPFAVVSSFLSVPLGTRCVLGRLESYIAAFLLGQSVAALHTVLVALLDFDVPMLLPGAVTESGQLVLIIPLILATAFYALSSESLRGGGLNISLFGIAIPPHLYAGLFFTALLVVAWPGAILLDDSSVGTLVFRLLALAAVLLLALPPLRRGAPSMKRKLGEASKDLQRELFQLVWPAAALLFAALLINLKRGPWLGVFVELMVIGYVLSKRLLFWSATLTFFLLLALSPARTRMENLEEHFAISGGRKEMWNLGAEIVQRYPLGIGIHNARYMRELDPAIPAAHRHMHNNFLNVTVETGWIGLCAYLWWIFTLLSMSFGMWRESLRAKDRISRQLGVIALCLGVGLLGWQVAGFVEYNFGDGEIRLIALFFMGMIMTLRYLLPAAACTTPESKSFAP